MTPLSRLAVLLAFCALSAPTFASDAEAGRHKVYTCTGCHGIPLYKNVYPHYNVPKIAGQNREYLIAALTSYQKGERKHPTMRAQAESFTAKDIDDIATFLASIDHTKQ